MLETTLVEISKRERRWQALLRRHEAVLLALLLGLMLLLSLESETFFTWTNFANITRAFSWIAVAAFGEGMILIIGGVDLSVGGVMALAGLVGALILRAGLPVWLALLGGLCVGALVGWVNGMLVGRLSLPPLMVTLGTMSVARGVVFALTRGWPISGLPPEFRGLGQWDLALGPARLPLPFILMIGLALSVSLLLRNTVLGTYMYTLGGNERALSRSDVDVIQLRVIVYVLGGVLAAFAGLLMTARLGVAAPTAATGYELNIIAAAVIGGASLFGGEGSVLGILLGAAMMQVVQNGLVVLGLPSYSQTFAMGVMILAFILLDYWRRRSRAV